MMAPLDPPPESKTVCSSSSHQQNNLVVEDMEYQARNQRGVSSAVSTSSSLSYLSVARTPSPEDRGRWRPRRRHAPPPTLPTHRRARGYDDLFPFEVSQLASVLCHAPPVNTPRDGAVWTAYVCHTNERISLLGHKLRAATTLPSFLPWSINHGLCSIHRRLNAKPLEDIFAALRYEVEVRIREVWQPVALAGALSASQTQQLTLMEELRSLWLPPAVFMKKFNRLPVPKYAYQADRCVACMLSRMGSNVETAMALGAMLLGSMRRSDMLSTRVCFCREWVRYTVEGDVDCVDAALAEMERMGNKFREAREWARQRTESTSKHQERGLGLGSMPCVQPAEGSAAVVHQVFARVNQSSETVDCNPDKRTLGGSHDHQRIVNADQQSSPEHLPLKSCSSAPASQQRCSSEQPSPEPLPNRQPPSDLYSPEQYFSAHNPPEPCRPAVSQACSSEPSLPLQERYQVPALPKDWQDRNILLNPSSTIEKHWKEATDSTVHNHVRTAPSEKFTSTMVNTYPPNSPASLYSEFVINPFLDGSSSPSPIQNSQMPPDLPFRLFERRRAHSNDGSPSPPKNAVQWPNQRPLTEQSTAEQFKDGLVPVPCLARLGKGDRTVGALWRRRAEKMVASGKGMR